MFLSLGFQHNILLVSITGNIFGSYSHDISQRSLTFEFDMQSCSALSFSFAGQCLISTHGQHVCLD